MPTKKSGLGCLDGGGGIWSQSPARAVSRHDAFSPNKHKQARSRARGPARVVRFARTALDSALDAATVDGPLALPMDVRYSHGTEVYVVRACYEDDAADLIAIGGAHSVEVLLLVSLPPRPPLRSIQRSPRPVRILLQAHSKLPYWFPHHCHRLVLSC